MKIQWETEIDTPATVAVIGGGAIGIEAALYARFLGYYVLLIEGAKMSQSWRRDGHLPMSVPFGEAASALGIAALSAHRPDTPLPEHDETLSGLQFAEKYLVPLARTDLLLECVHVHSRVASVSRLQARREASGDIQDRADIEFRLAIHSKSRGWFTERADIVIDCSGVGLPRALGPGGGVAMGEAEHGDVIATQLPDLSGKLAAPYCGTRVLLAGTSHAALTNLLALIELMQREPTTRVTWLIPLEPAMAEPIEWLQRWRATGDVGQRFADRPEIQAALSGTLPGVVTLPGLGIERITRQSTGLAIRVQVNEDSTLDIECDRIVSSVGSQADWSHVESLRIGRSATLDRPVLEPSYMISDSGEPIDGNRSLELADSIVTMEPHYYVLGDKSFGLSHDRFTLVQGHQQVREAFALIGGRADLDLYKNAARSES